MGEGPRNRAAIVATIRTTNTDEDDWADHMLAWIDEKVEPPEFCRKTIFEKAHQFSTDSDKQLVFQTEWGPAPYLRHLFRADFLEKMHQEYGHLGYPGLMGVVTCRGWWPTIERDIRDYAQACPECQCAQRPRTNQEREIPRVLSRNSLELFDRWAIDLIGILPQTPAGNRWIFTAIEYLTGWPIAIALPNARAETVAQILHDNITMVYGPFQELLSDNGTQFTGAIFEAYLQLLRSKHRATTPYHPRTNGKVENFNGILGIILTKLLINKPTILWDQYLPQALFATRIRIHSGTERSPYFLLYGKNPRIASDPNRIRPLAPGPEAGQEILDRLGRIRHARNIANENLVEKAIKA
jgi:transposase InsO family protein